MQGQYNAISHRKLPKNITEYQEEQRGTIVSHPLT